MNDLRELIGKQVTAYIDGEKPVLGIVIDVLIIDYYFYAKNEPIYVTVNIDPSVWPLPDGVDEEDISDIPLNNIRMPW